MGDRNTTLATYLGDMHALEQHMMQPFERQLDLTKDMPEAHRVVQEMVNSCRQRMEALATHVKTVSGDAPSKGISDAVKTAISGLLGIGAAAVDTVRPQSASKALRDSYTALSLAAISYVMLQTTGAALNDTQTARIGEQHLQSVLRNLQSIASVMPGLVVKDIQDDVGTGVNTNVTSQITGSKSLSAIFGESQSRTV